MRGLLSFVLAAVLLAGAAPAWNCTTTLVGKDASADGSVMASHSEDGLHDPRLVYVPARDHEPGAMRPVYFSECALGYEARYGAESGLRFNIDGRSPHYKAAGAPKSVPLGHIPQVAHTFAYLDGNYGIMNEHQLIMGECTDKAKVHPQPEQGKRIFYSDELSRVALERCKTAREAIELMGELIMKYGYYGTGETLLVADPNEAWVMEMCGYDMNGTDGVWVAQRVPDDHIFVAANQFRIREVRQGAEDMMHSANIFDVARDKGWWDPASGPLDWTEAYGDGEFHHPYYSLRRVWRALSLAAPGHELPAWVEGPYTTAYPFSVKPESKMTVADVMRIHRDNYEGTEFDLTQGMAAGPFGNPNRFEGGAEATMADEKGPGVMGAFERPLNIYRCIYAYVCQARATLPDPIGGVIWFGSDRPATSVLLPFYAGAGDLPDSLQRGNPLIFDRESMWTAFNYVANYIMLKYSYMYTDLQKRQQAFETRFFGEQAELEARALQLWNQGDEMGARKTLLAATHGYAAEVLADWWKLSEELYLAYNDGYYNEKNDIAQPLFYPNWWLKAVGYEQGPLSYAKPAR